MNIFYLLLAIVSSGGFSSILTVAINRKNRKREYSEKVIAFWQDEHNKLMSRVIILEAEVSILKGIQCHTNQCPNRT